MVALPTLAFDISSVAVSTAIPGIAWALWFGLAWKHPAFAESLGLGRKEFWLLLPGALLASYALLPLAPLADDILAVSFAGAVFPLAVGALTLERIAPPLRRSGSLLFGSLAAETTVLLALVLLAERGAFGTVARGLGIGGWPVELGAVAVVAAGAVMVFAVGPGRGPENRAIVGTFALTNGVLFLTFAGASAIPGVGIAEAFPYYLLPPLLLGVVAALAAPRLFPGREGWALPVAFLAAGWGVVLGADVLWEPPLYGTGPSGLYAIGGAGVLDLVYLSGFLGLLGAWGTHRLLGRSMAPVGRPLPSRPPHPSGLVREAYVRGLDGELNASLSASAEAVRAAASQAHRLLGRSPSGDDRPWDGLAVPGWVVSDTANLESAARAGTNDPREAVRAWVTARALVQLGQGLSRPRFASIGQRLVAFAIDAAILGGAGAAVFAAIIAATPGSLNAALSSVPFSAAVYGLVAVALVYFAVSELWAGATIGKRLVGIEVRDRTLGPIGGVSALVRNAPLLPAMTLYAIGVSLAVAIAMRGIAMGANVGGLGLFVGTLELVSIGLFFLAGVVFAGAIGVIVIRLTADHQRVGDLWAGTWVVRRLTAPAVPPWPAPAPGPYG